MSQRAEFICAEVELKEDRREELAQLLIQGGFGLLRLEPIDLELENIFLSLTAPEMGKAREMHS